MLNPTPTTDKTEKGKAPSVLDFLNWWVKDEKELAKQDLLAMLKKARNEGRAESLKAMFLKCHSPTDVLVVDSIETAMQFTHVTSDGIGFCHNHKIVIGKAKFEKAAALAREGGK